MSDTPDFGQPEKNELAQRAAKETNVVTLREKKPKTKQQEGDEDARRKQAENMMGGYKSERADTRPDEWRWVKIKNAIRYIPVYKPHEDYGADVIDNQVPLKYWETRLDESGRPMKSKGKVIKERPSQSHLARQDYEITKIIIDPACKETFFRDTSGDSCVNRWVAFRIPPRPPEEQIAKAGEIVEAWLKLIYPAFASYILDHWAHAYQRLEQKNNVGIVFGGDYQGIGKDTLLMFFGYAFQQQNKVANIRVTDLVSIYSDYLLAPVLFLNEFHEYKGKDVGKVSNDLKSIAAAPPVTLSVQIKYYPRAETANIHRLYITTNHEDQFPRENNDRRFAVLSSRVTKDDVDTFIKEQFGSGVVDFNQIAKEWMGNAFCHYLLDRDITGFDCKNLPKELMREHDEMKKGFDVEPIVSRSLEQAALGFGNWLLRYIAVKEKKPEPKPIEDVTQNDWPEFICSQQIINSCAAKDENLEGEQATPLARNRGHLDRLMRTAGYQPVPKPIGKEKEQWRGKRPTSDQLKQGAVRVQTSALYVRRDKIGVDESVQSLQIRAEKFIRQLAAYWMTTEGSVDFKAM
ncbi:primase-helicase family protein [Paraburkholderia saeva]|uniref:primase-helicase family protein n=1 Tax=Paraburkholderia saeva TaxID=2777537 RepID=UPI001DE53DBB|nr:primase-helicase family protein [Paraburkholderia saeva]CAG4916213.1 hypothetical protein R70241_04426 [Paraburkholderia saeva]